MSDQRPTNHSTAPPLTCSQRDVHFMALSSSRRVETELNRRYKLSHCWRKYSDYMFEHTHTHTHTVCWRNSEEDINTSVFYRV